MCQNQTLPHSNSYNKIITHRPLFTITCILNPVQLIIIIHSINRGIIGRLTKDYNSSIRYKIVKIIKTILNKWILHRNIRKLAPMSLITELILLDRSEHLKAHRNMTAITFNHKTINTVLNLTDKNNTINSRIINCMPKE